MGADFIGGYVAVRKTRDEALAALAAISNDDLRKSLALSVGISDDDDNATSDDECREIALFHLNMVYDAVDGFRRDGAVWHINDVPCVFTGGMSWGDTPTDLCESVWVIAELGITA